MDAQATPEAVPETSAASPALMTVRDDSPSPKTREGVSFGPKHGSAAANRHASTSSGAGGGGLVNSDRMRSLAAGLHNLPELTLDETTRVRSVFTELMGERESISNILELRVILGDLGLYPAEDELQLVLDAYRGRMGLSGLCHYLCFYKYEYAVTEKIEAAKQQQRLSAGRSAGGAVSQSQRAPWMSGRAGELYPPSATRTGADTGYTFGSSSKKPLGDPDTLKAFIALGGNEDGSGEIRAAALSAVVREFGLTVDIDAMIAAVDVHHSGVLDYDDFCTMWSLPEEALRRSSIGSFSVLDASRSPRREDTEAADALAVQGGGDISPSTQRARERIIAALARSGRQSITLTQGLPWKANGAGLSPRATLGGANAASSPLGPSSTSMPVAAAASGSGVAQTQRVRPMHSCTQTNPVLQSAITDEEHMLLLTIFLFPERYEGLLSRPGDLRGGTGRHGNRHASISGALNGSGNRRSLNGRKHATHAASGASARKGRSVQGDDEDVLGGGGKGGGYRPPSPMILSMRTSAAYQERKTAKLREPIRCPYHGAGLAATMTHGNNGHAFAATASPNANAGDDSSTADVRNATW